MNEAVKNPHRLATTQAAEGVPRLRWTTADLIRLTDLGIFRAEDRIELIGGEIVPMPPISRRHEVVAETIENFFDDKTVAGIRIRSGPQFNLADDTYVEPDVMVYPATMLSYDVRGDTVLLVVEVAKSSLGYDLGTKALTYARHGVRDYWVVDAETLVTRVHRRPAPDGYGDVREMAPDQSIMPLLVPELAITMNALGLS